MTGQFENNKVYALYGRYINSLWELAEEQEKVRVITRVNGVTREIRTINATKGVFDNQEVIIDKEE